jgi:hypothetical protein
MRPELQGNKPGMRMLAIFSTIILLSLVIQLILSMKMAEDSYYLFALKKEYKQLEVEVAIIAQEVDLMKSVPQLHERAVEMGMVPSDMTEFLYLDTSSPKP